MAILSKDQLLAKIKDIIGDNTNDEILGVIEDISDTYDDYDARTKDSTDWKNKYEQNDEAWRKKYRDRFFNEPAKDEDIGTPPPEEKTEKDLTYDNLFKGDL